MNLQPLAPSFTSKGILTMRFAFALSALLASAAAAATLAAATPARTACTPGISKIGGFTAHTFCGSAKASIKFGGKTFTFSGGECAISNGFWTVNIGTIELGQPHTTKSYFGIALLKPSHADGTYKGVSFGFNVPGTSYLVRGATLTLRNGGKAASFAGLLAPSGTRATGSVTCQ
jgi:hypothetical protein